MKVYKIAKENCFELFIALGAQEIGAKIMKDKVEVHLLYIKQIEVGGANILKQDALSIGADVVVPKGAIIAKDKLVDIVLIGSIKQLKILSKKEKSQPFGLSILANQLKSFLNNTKKNIKIMGIININDDSFYKKSRFKNKYAIKQIKQMIKDGANIIDIGAVSSRPGSIGVSSDIELKRVKYICDIVKKEKLYKQVVFSIDSYTPKVIKYALKSGFKIVNDITGLTDDRVANLVAKYDATVIIMHMKGTPHDMQNNPIYTDIMIEIDDFFKQRILKAKQFGIKNIILDIGIGFGKTVEHNLILLKNMEHFLHFGYEILLGASRKSMIDHIVKSDIEDRLSGTLAIHLDSINRGVTIIRTHDVKEHYQAINVQQSIKNIIQTV